MRYAYNLRNLLRTFRMLNIGLLSVVIIFVAAPVAAQTAVQVAPFRSVELRDGGRLTLRHGTTQTVTLVKGSTDCAQFEVDGGGRLVIDKYKGRCTRKYELEIEIVTPRIAEILLANGGMIQSRGAFPRQNEITTSVRHGGTIDIRTIAAERVNASIEEGGRIFVIPQIALSASIVNGGQVTYWGDAKIESSVRHGGAVTKGTAGEADKPIVK